MEIDNNHHNTPIQKVTISGPLLSSLLLHLTTTTSTTTGLLFGHLSLLSPPPLSDDSPLSSTTSPSHSLTISSFSSSLHHHHHHHRPVGLFSSRHHSPLRPSLLDSSLSLSSPYHILLLLSSPPSPSSPIHSLDFRAFSIPSFDPLPIDILNIGPAFRANYTSFSPNSTFPHLPCETRGLGLGLGLGLGSPMREDSKETLSEMKRVAKDQKELDSYAEGFDVGGLSRLLGADAAGYVSGVEELYEKMLAKLEGLARLVEGSSAKVLDQENQNMKLRYKVAGIE